MKGDSTHVDMLWSICVHLIPASNCMLMQLYIIVMTTHILAVYGMYYMCNLENCIFDSYAYLNSSSCD